MISVLFGLLAALCWSTHDLLARRFSAETGPFRMSFWIMLAGAALLVAPVLWRGQIWNADSYSLAMALAMGVVYAFAIGGLLLAFSLAPVSIVGPLTGAYPALVVVWGLFNGWSPNALQWSGIMQRHCQWHISACALCVELDNFRWCRTCCCASTRRQSR